MKDTEIHLPDIKIIEPKFFEDDRGVFFESFNQQRFEEIIGYSVNFVQDNHSTSYKNVLRGLHYQLPPKAQGKLVRVVQGEVFDVAVDIRKSSSTFGQWVGEILSAENGKQIWIPEGFAHGFLVLSETADCIYKVTDYFEPEYERIISWSDPFIGIDWPNCLAPRLSQKDFEAKEIQFNKVFTSKNNDV